MTRIEKIKYFGQYKFARMEAERLDEEIMRWRAIGERVTAGFSAVRGGSPSGSRVEIAAEKIDELCEKLQNQFKECASIRLEIGNAIDAIESPEHRHVMRLRYINDMTWEQIAQAMNYCERQIIRIHDKE